MSKTVLLIGTLDTKGHEYAYIRDLIRARGLNTFVLDAGVLGEPVFTPDSPASLTAEAGGASLAALREKRDRGHAIDIMGRGARALAVKLAAEGKIAASEELIEADRKLAVLKEKVAAMGRASGGAWDEMKIGVERAWHELRDSSKRAFDKFS